MEADRASFIYQELQGLLEAQVHAIEFADDRASALIRFNALVLGLVTTGLSVAPLAWGSFGSTAAYLAGLLVVGLAALSLSTIMAVRAFVKRDVSIGLDADQLARAFAGGAEREEILSGAILAYRDGAEHNFVVMEASAARLQRALHLLSVGLVCLGAAAMGLTLGVAI